VQVQDHAADVDGALAIWLKVRACSPCDTD
jgi:hypothetical protein